MDQGPENAHPWNPGEVFHTIVVCDYRTLIKELKLSNVKIELGSSHVQVHLAPGLL